jgi:hypothetical protein
MTVQVPDFMIFEGRTWMIDDAADVEEELRELAPTDEQLGIRPRMVRTSNWRGRTDYFTVFRDQLYLFKVGVEDMEDQEKYCPPGARREVRIIYPQWECNDHEGMHFKEVPEKQYLYVFDDLKIAYTGEIRAVWPFENWWDFPECGEYDLEEELAPREELVLDFDDGQLIDTVINSTGSNRMFDELVQLSKELSDNKQNHE